MGNVFASCSADPPSYESSQQGPGKQSPAATLQACIARRSRILAEIRADSEAAECLDNPLLLSPECSMIEAAFADSLLRYQRCDNGHTSADYRGRWLVTLRDELFTLMGLGQPIDAKTGSTSDTPAIIRFGKGFDPASAWPRFRSRPCKGELAARIERRREAFAKLLAGQDFETAGMTAIENEFLRILARTRTFHYLIHADTFTHRKTRDELFMLMGLFPVRNANSFCLAPALIRFAQGYEP